MAQNGLCLQGKWVNDTREAEDIVRVFVAEITSGSCSLRRDSMWLDDALGVNLALCELGMVLVTHDYIGNAYVTKICCEIWLLVMRWWGKHSQISDFQSHKNQSTSWLSWCSKITLSGRRFQRNSGSSESKFVILCYIISAHITLFQVSLSAQKESIPPNHRKLKENSFCGFVQGRNSWPYQHSSKRDRWMAQKRKAHNLALMSNHISSKRAVCPD